MTLGKSPQNPPLLVVGGPTASGKTALGVELALRLGGEIVNADSQQVYRGLDIGTGKPTLQERRGVPHHLFDVVGPGGQLDAAQFAARADAVIAAVAARGRVPVVVGGTGLWIRALLRGLVDAPGRDEALRARLEQEAQRLGWPALHERLARVDPEGAARIQPTDPVRIVRSLEVYELSGVPLSELHRRHARGAPRYRALQVALDLPRAELYRRIDLRAGRMYEEGLVEETERASSEADARTRLARVMGYREALALLHGELSLARAVELTATAQRQYARRQLTWFRAEPAWRWLPPAGAADAAVARWEAFVTECGAGR